MPGNQIAMSMLENHEQNRKSSQQFYVVDSFGHVGQFRSTARWKNIIPIA